MTQERYIGVMSGTSMDGVDTALVAITPDAVRLLAHDTYPMPESLKQRLLALSGGQTHLVELGALDHILGHLFADAVNALLDTSGYRGKQIRAIGNHGQTVYHHPCEGVPFTMQLGDGNIVATKTGIDTVADFRRKDMALGGQGAPLVPAFHQTIFAARDSSVVVLNIGGIANISVLRPGKPVLGYDTGPGNTLMDAWCRRHTGQGYDKDAAFASRGGVDAPLLAALMDEAYLSRAAPKSTGRELFNLPWLEKRLTGLTVAPQDVARTLCEYTARTIAAEVRRYRSGPAPRLRICGGGARNPLLLARLGALLPDWKVTTTDAKGVPGDAMEAMAFAWLAQRRIHNLPSNLPAVTGAARAASLGVLYFA